MTNNPILIVDDDNDDIELIREAVQELQLPNDVHFFNTGDELVTFMHQSADSPFMVLCDVNLGGENGFELRKRLAEASTTRYKSVPFIFWSTAASESQIKYAYDLPAQGFFNKAHSYTELKKALSTILDYWRLSLHPK